MELVNVMGLLVLVIATDAGCRLIELVKAVSAGDVCCYCSLLVIFACAAAGC